MSMTERMADFYTLSSNRISKIGCLRALADFSQRNLSRETTEERDWRAAGPKTRSSQRLQPKNASAVSRPSSRRAATGRIDPFAAPSGSVRSRTAVIPGNLVGALSALCGPLGRGEAGADRYGAHETSSSAPTTCASYTTTLSRSPLPRGPRRRLRQARSTANRLRSASAQ